MESAAHEAAWGKKLPKGQGLGIAAHCSFTTHVAAVVEAAVDPVTGGTTTADRAGAVVASTTVARFLATRPGMYHDRRAA